MCELFWFLNLRREVHPYLLYPSLPTYPTGVVKVPFVHFLQIKSVQSVLVTPVLQSHDLF